MAANSFHLALVLAVDGQGNRTGRNGKQKSPVDELCAIWKQLVTDEEFKHTTIPAYSRTVTEVLAPFEKPQRTIDQADKINVEMCQLIQTECPHRLAYLGSGDAVKLARELSKDVRVWCESIFLSALDLHRNDSEKRSLIDQLFACLEQRIAQDANSYAMEYEHVLLLIRKN
uniref:Uncharacterized protein n=1 Tax=Plectus sambesii TaxID=2011161 RepID=A0A914V0V4_9BILA